MKELETIENKVNNLNSFINFCYDNRGKKSIEELLEADLKIWRIDEGEEIKHNDSIAKFFINHKNQTLDELLQSSVVVEECGMRLKIAECLIKKGADINYKDNRGVSSFDKMLDSIDNIGFVQRLLPKVDSNKIFFRALKHAQNVRSFIEFAKIFVEAGLDIKETNNDGRSLLFNSFLTYGRLEDLNKVFSFLSSHGLDINQQDTNGNTVLHSLARVNTSAETVKFLIKNNAKKLVNKLQESPIDIAKKYKNIGVVNVLNSKDLKTQIIEANYYEIDKDLQQSFAKMSNNDLDNLWVLFGDKEVSDLTKATLLHCVTMNGANEQVKFLIKKGALLSRNAYRDTALDIAYSAENIEKFKILCEAPNFSILMQPIIRVTGVKFKTEYLEILLEKANSASIRDLLIYCSRNGCAENTLLNNKILDLIKTNGINSDYLSMMIYCDLKNEIQVILNTKKNLLEEKNSNNLTPLVCATKIKNKDLIKLLIKNGANVNAQDLDGKTALHYLTNDVGTVDLEIVKVFFEAGYDFNLKDNNGFAALVYHDFSCNQTEVIKSFYKDCNKVEKFEKNLTDDVIINKILSKIECIAFDDSESFKKLIVSDLVKLQKNKFIGKVFEIVSDLEFSIDLWGLGIGPRNGHFSLNNFNIGIFGCFANKHDSMLSTICHELLHSAIFKIFDNECKPFFEKDEKIEKYWLSFTKSCIQEYPKIFKDIECYTDDKKPNEVFTFFVNALAKDILNNTKLINDIISSNSNFMSVAVKMAKNFDKTIELEDLIASDYNGDYGDLFDLILLNETQSETQNSELLSELMDDNCWFGIGS